jgi:hypothetical protein
MFSVSSPKSADLDRIEMLSVSLWNVCALPPIDGRHEKGFSVGVRVTKVNARAEQVANLVGYGRDDFVVGLSIIHQDVFGGPDEAPERIAERLFWVADPIADQKNVHSGTRRWFYAQRLPPLQVEPLRQTLL